jgi:hypothetical protein
MSDYSWCFTWSDLDEKHKLKLISEKFLEKYPYLADKDIIIGDSFTIIKMGGQKESPHGNSTWAHIKHNRLGIEFMLNRADSEFFYHKYSR